MQTFVGFTLVPD